MAAVMAMSKLYRYTLLRCDGTEELLETRTTEMWGHYIAKWIGASSIGSIGLLPPIYYENWTWGPCRVYVDQEARAARKPSNQHFKYPKPVYGDCLRVELVPATAKA